MSGIGNSGAVLQRMGDPDGRFLIGSGDVDLELDTIRQYDSKHAS